MMWKSYGQTAGESTGRVFFFRSTIWLLFKKRGETTGAFSLGTGQLDDFQSPLFLGTYIPGDLSPYFLLLEQGAYYDYNNSIYAVESPLWGVAHYLGGLFQIVSFWQDCPWKRDTGSGIVLNHTFAGKESRTLPSEFRQFPGDTTWKTYPYEVRAFTPPVPIYSYSPIKDLAFTPIGPTGIMNLSSRPIR